MADSYLSDLPEVAGHSSQPGKPVTAGGVHREPLTVSDNDMAAGDFPGTSNTGRRQDQVDQVAIEYLDGAVPNCPRTLAEEKAEGGYAQPGDQSFPVSGPRTTAGMRGAADMGR